jgi:hypothetical protein
MAKGRAFSILLLKEEFDATSALKDDNDANVSPDGAALCVLDAP